MLIISVGCFSLEYIITVNVVVFFQGFCDQSYTIKLNFAVGSDGLLKVDMLINLWWL